MNTICRVYLAILSGYHVFTRRRFVCVLSDDLLNRLAVVGLDIVMIHVDEGQIRPDLSDPADIDAVNRLRETLAAKVHAHGISVGLCTTLYPDSLANLPALVGLFLRHAHINFPKVVFQAKGLLATEGCVSIPTGAGASLRSR
ncbi:MAG: hypothetical protein QM790_17290 [Nibricoccus sp.]